MDFTLDSTEKIISISIAGLGAVAFIVKKLILPKFRKMKEHFLRIREMMGKVNHIYSELSPNGGSSIKDKINKIQGDLVEIRDLAISGHLKTMLLFTVAPESLFECSLNGKTIWANNALGDLFECEQADLMDDRWISFIHPDDVSKVWSSWMESIETLHPYRVRYRIISPISGKIKQVEATASLLRNGNGKPLSFWGKVVEIKQDI